jgi:hypothetical protein
MLGPLILLLALSSWPFAQNISRAQGVETKIVALENLWNQMQINHDADAMGTMLASNFVLTDYDGSVMSKAQFLASLRDKSNQLTVEVSDPRWSSPARPAKRARRRGHPMRIKAGSPTPGSRRAASGFASPVS